LRPTVWLPLWAEVFGNFDWWFTKFPPEMLDRLAPLQQDFDDNYHPWESGWRLAAIRDRWAHQAKNLATEVREAPRHKGQTRRRPVADRRRSYLLAHRPDDLSRSGFKSAEPCQRRKPRLSKGRRHRSRTMVAQVPLSTSVPMVALVCMDARIHGLATF
jgi:hypothetical protein